MLRIKNVLFALALLFLIAGCSGSRHFVRLSENPKSFSAAQEACIMQGDILTPMRVFKTTSYSDSLLLRAKSSDVIVETDDPVLHHFISRLYSTVRDSLSLGVGIAAPQVGILKNVIWVQRFDKEGQPFEVYLNPKIIQYSSLKQECREGCLSIPNRSDTLQTRAYAILIEYERLDKTRHVEMIEDFTAVIFQHEIDHLNGILYLDRIDADLAGAKKE
ncbi:MAG: peptide deformylase [Bacteroidales bacterium]|nr:peptide deformylase [Bacteroidales bacterium]